MSGTLTPVEQASHEQRRAANPDGSFYVAANAGSGKTHVLVNRVSRLLLRKVKPDQILCLTYTKAAASEMQTRLFEKLGEWSVMEADKLGQELQKLYGEADHGVNLSDARALFAKALETPGGLKVQTIHAFCEFVLSRFPIEAGLLPGFETLSDSERVELLALAKDDILREAISEPDGDIAKAIKVFASQSSDATLDKHFTWMGHNIYGIGEWVDGGGTAALASRLGMDENITPDDIRAQAWEDTDQTTLQNNVEILLSDKQVSNQKVGAALVKILEITDPAQAFDEYTKILLTAKGELRASVVTTKAPETAQQFFGCKGLPPTPEGERVLGWVDKIASAHIMQLTRSLYVIAKKFAKKFEDHKKALRRVTFDDQIMLVRDLLENKTVSDWIKYKLDGGISHMLIDEAQDTPPKQWDILNALYENFDAQDLDNKTGLSKSRFAVGDEKQSIYSFQGARPEIFLELTQKTIEGQESLSAPRMRHSFRSTPHVMELVDQVFINDGGAQRMFDPEKFPQQGIRCATSQFARTRAISNIGPSRPI